MTQRIHGSSEMADRIRAHDWDATPLGSIGGWPQSLATAVDLMLASAQPAYIGWGPDLISLYNDGCIAIAGDRHPACLGLPYLDMWPEIRDAFRPVADAVMAGEPRCFVDQPVALSGRAGRPMSWFTFSFTPLRNDQGAIAGFYCTAVETTDRVLAERERNSSYRALFEMIDEGYVLADVIFDDAGKAIDIQYVDVNAAATRMMGADLKGRRLRDVSTEYEDYWYEIWGRVARTGVGERLERYATPEQRWYDFYVFKPDPDDTASTRVAVLFHDASQRKAAEAGLRESETRHRLLVESWAQAVWETDAAGVVVKDSPSWRAYTGQTLEEWLGYGWLNAIHPDDRAYVERQWREAVAACSMVDAEFRLRASAGGWRWTNVRAAPLVDAAGDIEKWLGLNLDIDDRKRAEDVLRDSEERQAFLLQLSDMLAELSDPVKIEEAASRLLGKFLGALRVGYGEVVGDELVIQADYANGVSSLRGRYPIDAFGTALADIHRNGGTIVIGDAASDPSLTNRDREEYRSLGVAAHVTVAIHKTGRPVISLGVQSGTPRTWSGSDIALIHDVADRTCAAIRRAQIDGTLRDSEDHRAFLLKLSDALRPLTGPGEIQHAAMKLLAERFDVMRAGYLDVDADGDMMTMAAHFQRIAEPVPDRIRLSDYGPDLVAAFRSGQTRNVCDTEIEVLTDEERAAHRAIGIRAWIIAPLVKDGQLIAIVGVVSSTPRDWTPIQVQMVTDLAERTWDAVQRARAEAALRDSEARYRLLFETIDEGFCLCERVPGEPIDYRYIVVNPAFDRQSGLDHPVGKTIREIVPGVEETIMKTYARVEATRVPEHFTTHVADLDQWFDVETIPTDQPGRIAMLFRNVTGRKQAEAALRESEERLQTLVSGVPQLVWRAFDGGHWTWASPQWTAFTGQAEVDSHGFGWLDHVHPEDRERLEMVWAGAMERGDFHADFRVYQASKGGYAWFQSRATPVRDDDGRIIEWLGTSTDVDDLRALQERQDTLLAELQHRVRNILAVTRSIINRSDDGERSTQDYVQHLQGRIAALARTQVLLTRAAGGDVDLETLIHDELLAQAASHEKVMISGSDVALSPKVAEVLTLAIHELTTNATKYGALSRPDGRIQVNWQVERRDAQDWVSLTWVETGVPIVDAALRRRGFGAELISRRIPYELRGSGTLEMKAGGVVSRIEFPLLAGDSILQTDAGAR